MKKFLLVFLIFPFALCAQKQVAPCATNDIHEEKMRTDSNYRKDIELVEKQIQAKLAKDAATEKKASKDTLKKKSKKITKHPISK